MTISTAWNARPFSKPWQTAEGNRTAAARARRDLPFHALPAGTPGHRMSSPGKRGRLARMGVRAGVPSPNHGERPVAAGIVVSSSITSACRRMSSAANWVGIFPEPPRSACTLISPPSPICGFGAFSIAARRPSSSSFVADQRAWHAGTVAGRTRENCNDFSLGIGLEGCDAGRSDPGTRGLAAARCPAGSAIRSPRSPVTSAMSRRGGRPTQAAFRLGRARGAP